MPITVDLANYTLTVYTPGENHEMSAFSTAERNALETQLKSRGYTLNKSIVETSLDGVFFRATRDSDGAAITIKVERK